MICFEIDCGYIICERKFAMCECEHYDMLSTIVCFIFIFKYAKEIQLHKYIHIE